jgi:hypothetical protein
MIRILSLLTILIFYLVLKMGFAAEIDSITPRKIKLNNSLAEINSIFNQRIQEGIIKANEKQGSILNGGTAEFCDEEVLYTELRKAIYQSYTASWGLKGYDLDRQLRSLLTKYSYSLSLKDSIYRDINYLEGFSLNLKELSDVVNVKGYLIGLDKIGHFFAEGWRYFELTDKDDQKIEKALEWGKQQETGKFGYITTGIFSFADLTANFNGWRFWNKVLLKKRDPLKGVLANFFNRPYIRCNYQIISSIKNKKLIKVWEYNTRFDFSDYIDGVWDEANNCNSYKDPIIEKKVTMRIKNINSKLSCPLIRQECINAKNKYGDFSKYILHPYCLGIDDL